MFSLSQDALKDALDDSVTGNVMAAKKAAHNVYNARSNI